MTLSARCEWKLRVLVFNHKDDPDNEQPMAKVLYNNDSIYKYPCALESGVYNAIHPQEDANGNTKLARLMPWDNWGDMRNDMLPLRESMMRGIPNFDDLSTKIEILKDSTFIVRNHSAMVKTKRKNISMHMSKPYKYKSKFQTHRFSAKINVPTMITDSDPFFNVANEDTTHGFRNNHPPLKKLYCIVLAHPVIPGPLGLKLPDPKVMDRLGAMATEMRDEGKGPLSVRNLNTGAYKTHYDYTYKPPKPDYIPVELPDDSELELPDWYSATDTGGYAEVPPDETDAMKKRRLANMKDYKTRHLESALKEARKTYKEVERARIQLKQAEDADSGPEDDEPDFDPSFTGPAFAWCKVDAKISVCFRNNKDSRPKNS
jgi:hypothetical protein